MRRHIIDTGASIDRISGLLYYTTGDEKRFAQGSRAQEQDNSTIIIRTRAQ